MSQLENQLESTSTDTSSSGIDINHFKLCLKEYLKLDDEIKTLQTVLRNKRTKIEGLEETLLIFLEKNNINQVQLEGDYQGKELVSQKLTRTKNVSSNSLIDIVKSKCSTNQTLYASIMDEIENQKETNEVAKIKISSSKSGKKKKQVRDAKLEREETNKLLMGGIPGSSS
jgi:hypothetical protein